MKTTVDVADRLLARAKQHAKRTGQPLRALIEEGLRRVLAGERSGTNYRLPEASFGDPSDTDPLAALSWPELRQAIYGEPGDR